MFNLGMGEITVVLLLALIFIGPKKLPELASGLGKLIREIRKTTSDVKNELQLDDAIRKPFEELREAVTLHPEELKRRDRMRNELAAAQRAAAEISAKIEAQSNGVAAPAGEAAATPAALGAENTVPVTAGGAADAVSPGVPTTPMAAPAGTISRPLFSARPSAPAMPEAGAPHGHVPPPPPSLTSPVPPPPPTGRTPVQEELGDTLRRLSEVHHRNTGRMPAVNAPLPDSAADRSNTTQSLSEADLAAIAVAVSPPPPPPRATRSGRIAAPPMPGLTEAAPKPAAPPEEKKPDPAT